MSSRATSRNLADLAAHDVETRLNENSILLQPVGAVEAHGPHLPLATDLIVAAAAVEAATARFGDELDLWALPPLAYTKSNEHAWAPGTIWLTAQTLLAVLHDIGRSLRTTPARTIVFVNGHGGNSALLQVALRDLRLEFGFRTFLVHPWGGAADSELGMGIHAGHDETSIVMHLRPDLVDLTKARRHVPEQIAANKHVKWGGSVAFGWLSSDFEDAPPAGTLPLGVIGDPTSATAAHGAAAWERIITTIGAELEEIRSFRTIWKP